MPEKTRLQFSLRGLLIVTTLSAVLFSALITLGLAPFSAWLVFVVFFLGMVSLWLLMRGSVIRAASADPLSLQTVASLASDVDAAIVAGALKEAGIGATVVGAYTSGFRAEAPGEVKVVVALRDLGRAREVLAAMGTIGGEVDWSQVDVGEAEADQPQDEPSADPPGG